MVPINHRFLYLSPRKINPADFTHRKADAKDFGTLITEPTMVYVDKKLAVVYTSANFDLDPILQAADELKFRTDNRTDGLMSTSLTFGSLPRVTIRRDYCTAAGMAHAFPRVHNRLCSLAKPMADIYLENNPAVALAHRALTKEKARPEWVLPGEIFTSGIINKNNALHYHLDAGNYNDVWSAMLVLKRNVKGGYLSCPGLDVGFELKHGTILLFNGQDLLHGVTPIEKTAPDGARYSLVYYSLKGIWACLSPDEEYKRIAAVKTQRTQKRAAVQKALPVDMNASVKYPIYVPSKGRPTRARVVNVLRAQNLPFTLVVEPQDVDAYRAQYPDATFLVLPDNDRGIVYARQFILDHARKNKQPWYWQIDDNINGFVYSLDKATYPITVRAALSHTEQLLAAQPSSIRPALLATDYKQFGVMAEKDFTIQTRAYCCVLTRTDTGIDYRYPGKLDTKEDVDFCVQHMAAGWSVILNHRACMDKPQMGKNTVGGLAAQYRAGKNDAAARFLQTLWPQAATLVRKKTGWDVKIKWDTFRK